MTVCLIFILTKFVRTMAIGIDAIDKLRLDLAFGANFSKSWTIRADSRLLVVDDNTTNVS